MEFLRAPCILAYHLVYKVHVALALLVRQNYKYSETPLNGHPSTADTCDIDSIDFNILETPDEQTPRYSI